MSNARQQGAKSRLKDNSQMWKKSNVQMQWLNNKRLIMQVSTILREFIGMTTISQVRSECMNATWDKSDIYRYVEE